MSRLHPLKARTEALTALTGKFRGHEGDDPHIAAACEHLRNARALVIACERLEVSLDPVHLELTFPVAGDTSFLSALVADADGCVEGKARVSTSLDPGGRVGLPGSRGVDLHAIPGQKPPVPCFTPDPAKFFGKPKPDCPDGDSRDADKPDQPPVCKNGNTLDGKATYVLLIPSPNGRGYAGRLFDACQRSLEEAEKLLVE